MLHNRTGEPIKDALESLRTHEPIADALESLKQACLYVQNDSQSASLWQEVKESLEDKDLDAVRAYVLADFILTLLDEHDYQTG